MERKGKGGGLPSGYYLAFLLFSPEMEATICKCPVHYTVLCVRRCKPSWPLLWETDIVQMIGQLANIEVERMQKDGHCLVCETVLTLNWRDWREAWNPSVTIAASGEEALGADVQSPSHLQCLYLRHYSLVCSCLCGLFCVFVLLDKFTSAELLCCRIWFQAMMKVIPTNSWRGKLSVMLILKGSDSGTLYSELLGFWTLFIIWYSRN